MLTSELKCCGRKLIRFLSFNLRTLYCVILLRCDITRGEILLDLRVGTLLEEEEEVYYRFTSFSLRGQFAPSSESSQ